MNEQEAKGMLQAKLICMELDSNIDGCDGDCAACEYCYTQGTFGEQKEALKMAIKAIEKQIPKKPTDVITSDNEFVCYICPSCEQVAVEVDDKHCRLCGQKLDWTVQE